MTAAQHTTGPWHTNPDCDHQVVLDHLGHMVADCSIWSLHTHDSAELNIANARLIAAAPETAAERDRLREINAELLEALQVCVKAFEIMLNNALVLGLDGISDWQKIAGAADIYGAASLAIAAIAKATGEAS